MPAENPSDAGPRRFLIATAIETHTMAPHWDTPGLVGARARMIELFTEHFGYTLVDTLGVDATSAQLLKGVRAFCKAPDRRSDDVIALYFTGHGERVDSTGEYVLVASDTDPDDPATGVLTAELARQMLLNTEVRKLLLILDTCYSGKGGADFAAAALSTYTNHWADEQDTGVVVISSTQPWQWAQAGVFPELFTSAVQSLATAGYGPETIAMDAVITAIGNNPGRTEGQTIERTQVRVSGQIPSFLPNPRRDPQLTEVDLALQQASEWETHTERRDIEFRTRLLVRAMGNRDNKGWWFCGRHQALTDITTWLTHPDPTRPFVAVTGDPGSGKTAVLGIITTLTHPEYRRTVPIHTLGLPPEAIPPAECVDVAIYAQSLTVDQIRDGIGAAAHLTASTVGELLDGLARRPTPLTVLIDALDEAADPDLLTRKLLRPLIDHAGRAVRLLLGTRPYLLHNLGTDRDNEIDLDAPRYADLSALTTYAVRGLLEADPDTVYTGQQPELIGAVGAAVAEAADPSFLVARIVAATLSSDPRVPDPADRAWRRSLPSLPGDAMHRDLASRLGENADRARDLLRPLAFAQGQGLPWEDLWAALASRIASIDYTDHDLMWLRRHAGSYVVEATEVDRSAYRLYHQALAEHLAKDLDTVTIHALFVDVLCQRISVTAEGHRDWSRAHPYTLRHLATHAAHAGLVDELITDMDYLVHADPTTLLAAMRTVTTDTARQTRAIYRCNAAHHAPLPPQRRRQILAIDAARFHATHQQQLLNRTLAWPCRWATGHQTHPAHRTTLTGHTDTVNAVACTVIDGQPVAVTGSDNGTVLVWDLVSGIERAALTGHTHSVTAVACTVIDGQPVAVTASRDNKVLVWDLVSGIERAALTGHTDLVNAVACTVIDGHPAAVTSSDDGTVLVWDLVSGVELATVNGHTDWVAAVACTVIDGHPVAVIGCLDNKVQVWDLVSGVELAILSGHTDAVNAVACTVIDGRPVAVTGGEDDAVRVWDLVSGVELATLTGHTNAVAAVACTVIDGDPVVVTGSVDDTTRVWDLETTGYESPATGHTNWVVSAATVRADKTTIAVTAGLDDTVRVWDLVSGIELATLTGHTVNAVACTVIDGQPVAVTASRDNKVRVWDLVSGIERATLTGHTHSVTAVACTVIDGHSVAVTSSDDKVRVSDLASRVKRAIFTNHTDWVKAMACTVIDGRPVAVTGSDDGTVRVWDLASGVECATLTGHTKTVGAVACTVIDGQPAAVTSSVDQIMRIWNLRTMSVTAVIDCPTPQPVVAVSTGSEIVLGLGNDIVVLASPI